MKAVYSFVSTDLIFYFMAEAYNSFLQNSSTLEVDTIILYENGVTKELGINISADHTYQCWIDGESILIPGLNYIWNDVIEFSLPVYYITDAIGIEVIFTNIWVHSDISNDWIDIVGQ